MLYLEQSLVVKVLKIFGDDFLEKRHPFTEFDQFLDDERARTAAYPHDNLRLFLARQKPLDYFAPLFGQPDRRIRLTTLGLAFM